MQEKVKATAYTCDGCGKRTVCEAGELPEGFHGTVFEVGEWGASGEVPWFACQPSHIKQAVENALEEARRRA